MKKGDKVLASSAVSSQWQTHVIREVRAILGLGRGDRIQWILRDGEIFIERMATK